MKNQKRSLSIKIYFEITILLPSTKGTVSTAPIKIYTGVGVSLLCFK